MEETEGQELWQDKIFICIDCKKEFTFDIGEQKFYWSKGLHNPKRCPACRKYRKVTIARETS